MTTEKPILVGHTIYLRNPIDDDVIKGEWHSWYNDINTTKYNSHGIFTITREKELEYIINSHN